LIAVQTNNEKIFRRFCTEPAMVDIIAFDFSERPCFKIQHSLLAEANKRGIFFEILYSNAIKNPDERRVILSNIIYFIRLSRGKNLI